MRINDPPLAQVERPDMRGPLGAIAAVRPISPQTPAPAAPQTVPVERTEAPPAVAERAERRQRARRGEDRRKEQRSVMLDTRVAQRRLMRRRTEDVAPAAVDVEA